MARGTVNHSRASREVWPLKDARRGLDAMVAEISDQASSTPAAQEEQKKAVLADFEETKEVPIKMIFEMRGFYVKVGQLLAGFPGECCTIRSHDVLL